jgi:four helix bundle protein
MGKATFNYENLDVWKKAVELVKIVYRVTENFPKEEVYGLTSQIRRSAFSVPLNIAEGQGRKSKKDFVQFLIIARASLNELNTALLLAKEMDYIDESRYNELREKIIEISKMLGGLIKSLK